MEKYDNLINSGIVDIYKLNLDDLLNLKKSIINNDYKLFISLPIFVKCDKKCIENYTYFEYNESIYYYYKIPIFFNSNKKIIVENNQVTTGNLDKLLDLLLYFLNMLKQLQINVNNDCICYENVISIKRFNNLYGHLKDEMFGLADFYHKYNNNNYTPLIIYPNNDYYKNIKKIEKVLFNKVINPEYNNNTLIKINNIIIVDHHYELNTFHLFPKNITTKLINYFGNNSNNSNNINQNIFLTRNKITWVNHNINNNLELINLSKKKGYNIINPEDLDIEQLINYFRNSNKIITTFGSALVNLIYAKPNAKIIIIKSNSYKGHSINIFRNLIKNYNINYTILDCDNNNNIEPKLFCESI